MTDVTSPLESRPNWSRFQKTVFCFFFLFFGLQLFPFPIGDIPVVGEFIKESYDNLWDKLINISGKLFFGIPEITIRPNGSGDTTWNWVQLFLMAVMSVIGTLIWSIWDRKRPNYDTLNFWNNIYLRYFLGITMLSYGIYKVFPAQFGPITNYNMYQQLGDMSPMRLLWVFMAYSTKYQFFAGIMECIGGLLLLFRRTTLLGALLSLGIMANVFAMNVCFDVPVKIFSFLLVSISIYLAAPYFQQLINFFVLQKPTTVPPQYQPDFMDKKGVKIARIALKIVAILGLLGLVLAQVVGDYDTPQTAQSPFYGRYVVAKHIRNNTDVSLTDTLRWDRLLIDSQGIKGVMIASNDMGLRSRMTFEKNDTTKIMQVTMPKDTVKYTFSYQQPDTTTLILTGKLGNDSLRIELMKQKKKEFLLIKRGFHWINEGPFNK